MIVRTLRNELINHPASGRAAASIGSTPRPIYLDHQATTPVDPRVAAVVWETMTTQFGNANSVDHLYGEEAAHLLADARSAVAGLVGAAPEHVRFTSGATEGIRLALQTAVRKADGRPLRVACSPAEHRAVLDVLHSLETEGKARVTWLPVDGLGCVSLDKIAQACGGGIDLVCLMAANNEVGTLYPVQAATSLARDAGCEILVDATQAASRVFLDVDGWGIDYLVLSAHKIYGPMGIGALVGPDATGPLADQVAGHAGTPNVPGAVGFGEACRIAKEEGGESEVRICALRDRLEAALLDRIPGLVVNGDRDRRLTHNLHVSAPGAPNDAVVARLRATVALATGAACTSGAQEPSHVLRAMGLPLSLQDSALRISPGRFNTIEEIDTAADAIAKAVASVRAAVGEYA
jgi:cysteine desulfurase